MTYIAGWESDACVLGTCFDLFDKGVPFKVVTDCIASERPNAHEAAIVIMRRNFDKLRGGALMYKKLAVGISICSASTATVIPLALMWMGYSTPLKLVLWLYLLLLSTSLVFFIASLCYAKKDKSATVLFMVNALYNLAILTNSISDTGAVYRLWRMG